MFTPRFCCAKKCFEGFFWIEAIFEIKIENFYLKNSFNP